jgi:hypothetical protein
MIALRQSVRERERGRNFCQQTMRKNLSGVSVSETDQTVYFSVLVIIV